MHPKVKSVGLRPAMALWPAMGLRPAVALPAALTVALLVANSVARADAPQPEIPTCDKKIGTLAVTEPQDQWWLQYNLESPEALI